MKKCTLKYRLRTNDFNIYDNINPLTLFDIVQDIAGYDYEKKEESFYDTQKKGLMWIVARSKCFIYENIKPYDVLKVTTYTIPDQKIGIRRCYDIYVKHKLVSKIYSLWILIDIKNKKFKRNEKYIESNLPRLKKLDDYMLLKNGFKTEYKVTYNDIDHNHHFNNSRYLSILNNIIKPNQNDVVKSLEVDYIKDVHLDDYLTIYYKKEQNTYLFEIYLENEIILRAKVEY